MPQRLTASRWVRAHIAKRRAMRWGGKEAVPGRCVGAEVGIEARVITWDLSKFYGMNFIKTRGNEFY